MKLVDIPCCPVSGEPGSVEITEALDSFFGTEGKWQYRRNSRSGHVWLDPQPASEHLGELYGNYYTHSEQSTGSPTIWQQAISIVLYRELGYPRPANISAIAKIVARLPSVRDSAVMEMMRVPASRTGKVLDIGCGNGAFLRRMHSAGWCPTGMEPDPKAAAHLRDQFGFPVFSSIEEIEAQSARFNLITLSHVIEHLPNPLEMLCRLRSLLTTGGQLLITTPNAQSVGARIFGAHWRGLEPPRHFNVFTVPSLAEAVDKAGLRVEKISTHSRLARGIFYLSVMAKRGYTNLESHPRRQNKVLTTAGYVFQVAEQFALVFNKRIGEEIYCVAGLSDTDTDKTL